MNDDISESLETLIWEVFWTDNSDKSVKRNGLDIYDTYFWDRLLPFLILFVLGFLLNSFDHDIEIEFFYNHILSIIDSVCL